MFPTPTLSPSSWQILKRAEHVLPPADYPKWFLTPTPADPYLYLNSLPTDVLDGPHGNLRVVLYAFEMIPTLVTLSSSSSSSICPSGYLSSSFSICPSGHLSSSSLSSFLPDWPGTSMCLHLVSTLLLYWKNCSVEINWGKYFFREVVIRFHAPLPFLIS